MSEKDLVLDLQNLNVKFVTEESVVYAINGLNIQLERGKVHYALLPVWMLSTDWGGKRYMFAVNGQTGKTVGDLTLNKKKVAATFAAVAAAVAAVGCAIVALL